ncbi:hypothetical protein DQE84_17310, partial [Staphylococcus warneri]
EGTPQPDAEQDRRRAQMPFDDGAARRVGRDLPDMRQGQQRRARAERQVMRRPERLNRPFDVGGPVVHGCGGGMAADLIRPIGRD